MRSGEEIEGTDCCHDERPGHDRRCHIVHELPKEPGIGEQAGKTVNEQPPVWSNGVSDRVLHPGICSQDEVAGQPRPDEKHHRSEPLHAAAESALTIKQDSQERGFQKESEYPFHGQRLADDPAGKIGKLCPVGAELKFQRNAGDHAEGEAQRKDCRPEPSRPMVMLVAGPERAGHQVKQQQRQPHRQLWKEIMKSGGECKLQTVVEEGTRHESSSLSDQMRRGTIPRDSVVLERYLTTQQRQEGKGTLCTALTISWTILTVVP